MHVILIPVVTFSANLHINAQFLFFSFLLGSLAIDRLLKHWARKTSGLLCIRGCSEVGRLACFLLASARGSTRFPITGLSLVCGN